MSKGRTQKKNILDKIVYKKERQIFLVLVGLFVIGLSIYLYSVGSVVFAIVERRYAEKHVAELKSSISTLELSYFDQTKLITEKYAEAQGFQKPKSLTFQDRVSKVATTISEGHGY